LNYRGITLLCVAAKIFCSVINQRLGDWCEENGKLSDEQGGFRKGRGCVDQVFVLKEALRLRKGRKTFACFVDIRKAYDRTWRNGLWQKLWNLGVRGRMWRVIQNLYSNTRARVRLPGGDTDWFGIDTGLRQGCVLSPLLFDIFLDGLILALKRTRIGLNLLGDRDDLLCVLCFADDIVLLAESASDLQVLLKTLNEYLGRWRLNVNMEKTKVVVFGARGVTDHVIMLGNETVQQETAYRYLGIWFDQAGTFARSKRVMVARANRAMVLATTQITREASFSVKALSNIWKTLIRPHLEYGAEVLDEPGSGKWQEAERIQNKMGRKILRCGATTTTEAIRGDLGWISLRGRRWSRRINWWGRVVNMKRTRWVRKIYEFERRQCEQDPNMRNWCSYTRDVMAAVGLAECWRQQRAVKADEMGLTARVVTEISSISGEMETTVYRLESRGKEGDPHV
jgi:hypothetical protein